MITTEFERELINGLSELFPNINEYNIENIEEITGGADTHIWGFDFVYDGQKIELVARIYREGTSDARAEKEFQICWYCSRGEVSFYCPDAGVLAEQAAL